MYTSEENKIRDCLDERKGGSALLRFAIPDRRKFFVKPPARCSQLVRITKNMRGK